MASPLVAMLFAPGFLRDPAKLALTGDLIKLTFPYLLLISLTGFAGAILNSYQRFAVPALTPILLNLSLIAAALWVAPGFDEPVVALALGVLIAGFAQLLFQVPALAAIDLVPRPRWEPGHAGRKTDSYLDGAGTVWCVGEPDQLATRYRVGLLTARGQRIVAVLLR